MVGRIKLYEHENDWNKAIGSYDLEISANPSAALQVDLAKVGVFDIQSVNWLKA